MSYKTSYNRRGSYHLLNSKPPKPAVITSLLVGNPSGQKPTVHMKDITNGYDLYDLGADTPSNYPASTTKLMTLLLMWEYKSSVWTSETVTVNSADVTQPYSGLTLSFAGLQANDVLTWEDLAYCLMLPSGGDAAQCAGRILGDMLYTTSGNTGTQGVARFVERMNARAIELGMLDTTYFDPLGGSATGATIRNVIPARALSIVCETVFSTPGLRTISSATTRNAIITGANARTMALTNVIAFFNGPSLNPAGFKDSSILAAKTGVWQVSGPVNQFNTSLIWKTPSGYEVVVTSIGSESTWSMALDLNGIMYQALQDFPYLNASASSDPNFASVALLIGADTSIVDESSTPKTLTNTAVTRTTGILTGSALLIDDVNDDLHAGDIGTIGSGDFTAECWYAGPGSVPGNGVEYVFFIKAASGQREFAANWFTDSFNIFASSDGSNWTSHITYTPQGNEASVFFNGAPRHLALVKSGSGWHMFVNGEKLSGTVSVGTVFNGTANLSVSLAGSAPIGKLDEYRVTYGVARYTDDLVSLVARKFPRS